MAARSGIKRLASLYGMMEQMRSAERRIAAGAVDETACAAAIQMAIRDSHRSGGREALASANPEGRTIAARACEHAEARMEELAQVRIKREAVLQQAIQVHRESRLRREQMDRVVVRAEREDALNHSRQEQAIADDRFGSRLAWMRAVKSVETE